MPAKFKPSERVYDRSHFGQRMSTSSQKNRKWKHYWLKCTSTEELIDAINSDRTKPKHKQKFRNELVRRGVHLVWVMPDGTQIEKDRKLLVEWYSKNPQSLVEKLQGLN